MYKNISQLLIDLKQRVIQNFSNKQKKLNRIDYIDYLRASAVILMIFAHVLDATLSAEYKQDNFYRFLNFINGFVAPAFLFTAGASFTIILVKRKNDILNFRYPLLKQILRVLQLLLLGYFLHLPYKTLNQMNTILKKEEYISFLRCDILHVIAIGLFLSLILFLIIREENNFYKIIFIIAILIVSFTPMMRFLTFERIPIEISTFLNKNYRSIFPLFPWLSYLFIGSIIMYIIIKNSKENNLEDIFKKLFYLCIALIILSSIPEFIGINHNYYYNFWHTSVNIVCIKISVVLLYMIFMWYIQNKFAYRMKIFKVFGQESLFVYVIHLIIVYGSVFTLGLNKTIGRTLDRTEMFVIYLGVLFISLLLTYLWHFIKKISLLFTRVILFFFIFYFLYYFFTKPY